MMLPLNTNPAEAYRRVELDARIEGSDGTKLTQICLEAVVQALDQAQASARRDDRAALRNDLSRAGQVILGLERSIDPASPMSQTLREFYGSANLQVRQMSIRFNRDMLETLRQDFLDVMNAMQAAMQAQANGRVAA